VGGLRSPSLAVLLHVVVAEAPPLPLLLLLSGSLPPPPPPPLLEARRVRPAGRRSGDMPGGGSVAVSTSV
jgi:hypothetical protein